MGAGRGGDAGSRRDDQAGARGVRRGEARPAREAGGAQREGGVPADRAEEQRGGGPGDQQPRAAGGAQARAPRVGAQAPGGAGRSGGGGALDAEQGRERDGTDALAVLRAGRRDRHEEEQARPREEAARSGGEVDGALAHAHGRSRKVGQAGGGAARVGEGGAARGGAGAGLAQGEDLQAERGARRGEEGGVQHRSRDLRGRPLLTERYPPYQAARRAGAAPARARVRRGLPAPAHGAQGGACDGRPISHRAARAAQEDRRHDEAARGDQGPALHARHAVQAPRQRPEAGEAQGARVDARAGAPRGHDSGVRDAQRGGAAASEGARQGEGAGHGGDRRAQARAQAAA
mmetsp:Transcript_16797/g.41615  ORF Transcript_16797/g.41615 Transcript_16797/m.41615 type:complete len:347 (-) Transcript_16797:211-1251(-)